MITTKSNHMFDIEIFQFKLCVSTHTWYPWKSEHLFSKWSDGTFHYFITQLNSHSTLHNTYKAENMDIRYKTITARIITYMCFFFLASPSAYLTLYVLIFFFYFCQGLSATVVFTRSQSLSPYGTNHLTALIHHCVYFWNLYP